MIKYSFNYIYVCKNVHFMAYQAMTGGARLGKD